MNSSSQLQMALGLLVVALLGLGGAIGFLLTHTSQPQPITQGPQVQVAAAGQKAPEMDAEALKGKEIFGQACAQCHATTDEVVVGPGLKGIGQRRDLAWLTKWVQNPAGLIKTGDAYAVQLFDKYKPTMMPGFPYSEEEIKAIFHYVQVVN